MSTDFTIRPANHPFRFLLYVEWTLLGIALFGELVPALMTEVESTSTLSLLAIIGFAVLGLRLPIRPLGLKIAHVFLQLTLVYLAGRLGSMGLRLFPLLYVVLVLRSCLLFRLPGRLVVTSISFVFFLGITRAWLRSLNGELPRRLLRRLFPHLLGIRLNLIIMFIMLLVFLLLLMNALLSERESRDELDRANRKLRESANQIEALAMAQERARIARDIHDSLGHALTGLNIQLEGALKLWDGNPEQARQFVAQAKEMGSIALQETRQAVATLRETKPIDPDLAAAIAPLSHHFQQLTGIVPQVTVESVPLSQPLKLAVHRIVQEALTNVCKHAQADAVAITVQRLSEPSRLGITVKDNGVGFHPQDNTTGFGLKGIQERAEAEGGQLQLISSPGQGCTIHVWLPLAPEAT
ncbi:sensor histidine kinase [Oscillatoria sp. CS-180]|uniref:sensor histidine kinase n=1 Tax=Oscillatoria sp. CS-180 TaxID=3021720 RepID=UPI00232E894E|nr:sensor histidine kinase [Oscillatoria sp. CS-180]MDB9526450.1 sensor histidine kinase [Oscillatoria sp. CS-180]